MKCGVLEFSITEEVLAKTEILVPEEELMNGDKVLGVVPEELRMPYSVYFKLKEEVKNEAIQGRKRSVDLLRELLGNPGFICGGADKAMAKSKEETSCFEALEIKEAKVELLGNLLSYVLAEALDNSFNPTHEEAVILRDWKVVAA